MLVAPGCDRVRTLRAIGAAPDLLALRRRLEHAIETASLRPRGLSSHAILCVRTLRMAGSSLHSIAWPARLAQRMEHVAGHAVRPFLDVVPANAEAVVFHDEPELLACLVRDARSGNGDAWWWRSLFGDAAHDSLVHRTLLASPTLVPATIARLAECGIAEDMVRALSLAFCERLSAAVRSVFGLECAMASRAEVTTGSAGSSARRTRGARARDVAALDAALSDVGHVIAHAALEPEQRDLLVLALVLVRAPWLARAYALRPLVERWLAERAVQDAPNMGAYEPTTAAAPPTPAQPLDSGGPRAMSTPLVEAVTVTPEHLSLLPAFGFATHRSRAELASADASVRPAASAPSRDPAAAGHANTLVAPSTGAQHRSATAVWSEYAGVLYLVNVALHLELYADFANPSRHELSLPLGDFLSLVSAHVCGSGVRVDPLWGMLAALAGRELSEEPGCDFAPHVLSRWIRALANRMATRTARALGMSPASSLAFLCVQHGRIAMTDTRIDAYFPLATHALDIRIAGLDRDPGWVPAAGRVIEFHYA